MNSVEEAIRTGRRGVVFMKGGQIGGTDCMINAMLWLKEYFPGPQLFLTSTDEVAGEFGRERFAPIIRDMEPLFKKYIAKKRGDILTKRFIDGKIQLCGGQSVFRLQSTPYRVVVIDELDSLKQDLGNQGDPLKLAEVRMDSFSGQTLMIAYAHPSTKERGAAKLFYELSDQRRGFVRHDCGHSFWLQWGHVKATPSSDKMTPAQAENDPGCYAYYCPSCGAQISDAERVGMVRGVEYRSTLDPEEAKRRPWIGVHASQLYSPAKTIRFFAARFIESREDEERIRVFYNKTLGEPYEPKLKESTVDDWRRLIVIPRRENDPDAYRRGQVPPGVRFLTAGQDSKSDLFHYAVWGWGLARTVEDRTVLRRWLIDWDTIKRKEKDLVIHTDELFVFDQLIYDRLYPTTYSSKLFFEVRECAHDTGWSPNAIYEYTRHHEWRAIPTKGGNDTSLSKNPIWREANRPRYKVGEEEFELDQPLIVFNTYQLKFAWYNSLTRMIDVFEYDDGRDKPPTGKRRVNITTLPLDIDEEFLTQSCAEYLAPGKRKGEKSWEHKGDNHYADCNTYADALAQKINPFQGGLSFEEAAALAEREEAAALRRRTDQQAKAQKGKTEDNWLGTDRNHGEWISGER